MLDWFMIVADQEVEQLKIDLKAAYRSVPVHESTFQALGRKWKFKGDSNYTYMYDTRLPFGSKLAPSFFDTRSQSVIVVK